MERKWIGLLGAAALAVRVCLVLAVPEIPGISRAGWRAPEEILASFRETPAPSPEPAPAQAPPAPGPTPEPLPSAPPADSPAPDMPSSSSLPETSPAPPAGALIQNLTSADPEAEALSSEPLSQSLSGDGPQILILHTHGTEAYMPVPGEEYDPSDPYRTTDPAHSVIRVGDVLCAALERQGLRVIHDRNLYDYPSYTGSYSRSQAAAEEWLRRYPSVGVVIDLHRDGVEPDRTDPPGDAPSALMLVIGTGENGLEHPLWRENLKLALAMERALLADGEARTRPIRLVRERYNQHLSTGAFILEVGSNADSLSQAERAAELFARAVGPLFLSLAEAD